MRLLLPVNDFKPFNTAVEEVKSTFPFPKYRAPPVQTPSLPRQDS